MDDYVYYYRNNILYYLAVDRVEDNILYYKNDLIYTESNDDTNIYERVLYSGIYNLIMLIYSNNATRYMSCSYILDNYNDYYNIVAN